MDSGHTYNPVEGVIRGHGIKLTSQHAATTPASAMSGYAAVNWAYHHSGKMNSGQRAVLVALCQHADQDWSCFPSQERLAEMTCLTERSVRTNLTWLEENGLISRSHRQRENGSRTTDVYVLNPTRLPAESSGIEPEKSAVQPEVSAGQPEEMGGTITTTRTTTRTTPLPPASGGMDQPLLIEAVVEPPPKVTFDDFWKIYPRHVAVGAARKAWEKAVKTTSPEVITAGLRDRLCLYKDRPKDKIPHASTWLNAEQWLDEIPASAEAPDSYDDYRWWQQG